MKWYDENINPLCHKSCKPNKHKWQVRKRPENPNRVEYICKKCGKSKFI